MVVKPIFLRFQEFDWEEASRLKWKPRKLSEIPKVWPIFLVFNIVVFMNPSQKVGSSSAQKAGYLRKQPLLMAQKARFLGVVLESWLTEKASFLDMKSWLTICQNMCINYYMLSRWTLTTATLHHVFLAFNFCWFLWSMCAIKLITELSLFV